MRRNPPKRFSIVVLTIGGWCLASTLALAQKTPAVGSRTAKCQADCRAGNTHGLYRAYNSADPHLVSPEGRKMYAECVRLCLAPLPSFYIQKPIIESGGSWFGSTKADCMTCHAKGETKGRWTGAIMIPDALKQGP
jgi:hypothetical protein